MGFSERALDFIEAYYKRCDVSDYINNNFENETTRQKLLDELSDIGKNEVIDDNGNNIIMWDFSSEPIDMFVEKYNIVLNSSDKLHESDPWYRFLDDNRKKSVIEFDDKKTDENRQSDAEGELEKHLSGRTIRAWINGGEEPRYDQKTRYVMYQFLYILGVFEPEEIKYFFEKVYLARVANNRNIFEFLLYHGLAINEDYNNVERAYVDLKKMLANSEKQTNSIHSSTSIRAYNKFQSLEEIEKYITLHITTFSDSLNTASRKITNFAEKAYSKIHDGKKIAESSVMDYYVLFGEMGFDYTELSVKNNYGIARQIEQVFKIKAKKENGKSSVVEDDWEARVKLMILHSFLYWTSENNAFDGDDNDISKRYLVSINNLLVECGLPLMYADNPFDALFYKSLNRYNFKGELDPHGALEPFNYIKRTLSQERFIQKRLEQAYQIAHKYNSEIKDSFEGKLMMWNEESFGDEDEAKRVLAVTLALCFWTNPKYSKKYKTLERFLVATFKDALLPTNMVKKPTNKKTKTEKSYYKNTGYINEIYAADESENPIKEFASRFRKII